MEGILKNKVIVVTGAAKGIGESAARLFTKHGAKLIIADFDVVLGKALEAELVSVGAQVHFVKTDVTVEAEVKAMVAAAVERFGRLDGAFNNAGIAFEGKLLHLLPIESWQRNIDVNLKGPFLCMKHEIAVMLENGGGSIVNTASISGVVASQFGAEYNAAKHGVIGLTRNGALDYAKSNIRVNAVCPGFINTPMTQEGLKSIPGAAELVLNASLFSRLGEPIEIAEAAMWLLSDAASFVTGASLLVDGGYTVQ